jgi:hypothetical protein
MSNLGLPIIYLGLPFMVFELLFMVMGIMVMGIMILSTGSSLSWEKEYSNSVFNAKFPNHEYRPFLFLLSNRNVDAHPKLNITHCQCKQVMFTPEVF